MKLINLALTTLLLASANALRADDGNGSNLKTFIAFGFNISNADSRALTQQAVNVASFTGEFGVEFLQPQTGLILRPTIGVSKMAGDKQSVFSEEAGNVWIGKPQIYDMMAIYGALDIVYYPFRKWEWGEPIMLSTGPTLLTWNVDELYPDGNDYNQQDKGTKMGRRVGAGYEVNAKIRVELTYTLSEWRSRQDLPYRRGWNPSRPSFFCIKGSYVF